MSRNVSRSAVFFTSSVPVYGWYRRGPQGSPVRVPGRPTRLLPPTRLVSAVRLSKLNGERIMSTQFKVTSTRRTRKAKSVAHPKVVANIIHLSAERKKESALEEWSCALKVYRNTM